MSLNDLVMSLIADISDPAVRMDIAATIYYLRDVYMTGRVREEEILESLQEVCETVIRMKRPDLTDEEVKAEAEKFAKQLMQAIKLETMRMRMIRVTRMRFSV